MWWMNGLCAELYVRGGGGGGRGFFFKDTATTVIYTLSLHDALPIFVAVIASFFAAAALIAASKAPVD